MRARRHRELPWHLADDAGWFHQTSACEKIKFVLGWRASSPRSGKCRGAIASEKKRNDNEEDKDDAVEE